MTEKHDTKRMRKLVKLLVLSIVLCGCVYLLQPYFEPYLKNLHSIPCVLKIPETTEAAERSSQDSSQVAKTVLDSPLGRMGGIRMTLTL